MLKIISHPERIQIHICDNLLSSLRRRLCFQHLGMMELSSFLINQGYHCRICLIHLRFSSYSFLIMASSLSPFILPFIQLSWERVRQFYVNQLNFYMQPREGYALQLKVQYLILLLASYSQACLRSALFIQRSWTYK